MLNRIAINHVTAGDGQLTGTSLDGSPVCCRGMLCMSTEQSAFCGTITAGPDRLVGHRVEAVISGDRATMVVR